jgi:hypothetical protein
MKPADWSRQLPQRLVIPTLMTLSWLSDVRELMLTCRSSIAERPLGVTSSSSSKRRRAGAETAACRSRCAWRYRLTAWSKM